MTTTTKLTSLMAALFLTGASIAQTPAGAPAGSTGMCKDGSYWTGATKQGACHGHMGVQEWYGVAGAAAGSPAATTLVPAAAPAAAAPATAAPVAAATKASAKPAATAAAGGGADKVWVNISSKVYHCPSDRWYGKTQSGTYMSEADAIAQGNHADHGKACSK